MKTRKPQRKIPIRSAVRMAIAAIENERRPVDMPVAGVDPSPGALDLPEMEQPCSRRRPEVDRCPECGSPLCGDCVAEDDG